MREPRETYNYIEETPPPQTGFEYQSPWLVLLFRPLVLTLMAGCVLLSLVQLLRLIFPVLNLTYLVIISMVGAATGYYSYYFTQRLIPSEIDRQTFRLIFVVVSFFVIKLTTYFNMPPAVFLADVQAWFQRPWEFVTLDAVVSYVLFLVPWAAGLHTASDFERIGEPSQDRREQPPMESLSNRFFVGGAILLILAGVTRIGIAAITRLDRPPVPGLILNVLAYYVLGLVLLGQTRWVALFKRWTRRSIPIAADLPTRWMRYSFVLLLIAAVVAFILPTGYTLPLLEVGAWIVWIMWVIGTFFLFLAHLLLYPLALLFAALFGTREPDVEPRYTPPPQLFEQETQSPLPPWLAFLRSLLFWGVLLGVLTMVIVHYLRDHPQIGEAVSKFGPIRLVRKVVLAIWGWVRGAWATARERLPRLRLGRRLRKATEGGPLRFLRPRPRVPREQVIYHYLNTLERAKREGIPRRSTQTPVEYRLRLAPEIPNADPELTGLTSDFVEARYSAHEVGAEMVERARQEARRVEAALEERRRHRESAPDEGETEEPRNV